MKYYRGLLITTRASNSKGEKPEFEAKSEDHEVEADGEVEAKAKLAKQADLRQRVERAHGDEKSIVRYVFRGIVEPKEETKD